MNKHSWVEAKLFISIFCVNKKKFYLEPIQARFTFPSVWQLNQKKKKSIIHRPLRALPQPPGNSAPLTIFLSYFGLINSKKAASELSQEPFVRFVCQHYTAFIFSPLKSDCLKPNTVIIYLHTAQAEAVLAV